MDSVDEHAEVKRHPQHMVLSLMYPTMSSGYSSILINKKKTFKTFGINYFGILT